MGTVSLRRLSWILLAVAAIASGCDSFRPADPEPPSRTSFLPNYRSPDSTLETIARAIADKGRTNGQSAYNGAFADTATDPRGFHAFFDPQTLNRMRQLGVVIPEDWDRAREDAFYSRFVTLATVPLNSEYVLQWRDDPTQGEDEIGAETAVLHREYQGFAILSGGETPTIVKGFATLHFVLASSSRWAIVRWEDREASDAQIDRGEVSFGQRRLEP